MNQNKLIRPTIYGVAWAAFIYACMAFFRMDLNAANWSSDARFVVIIFGFLMGAFISVIMAMIIQSE